MFLNDITFTDSIFENSNGFFNLASGKLTSIKNVKIKNIGSPFNIIPNIELDKEPNSYPQYSFFTTTMI